MQELVKKKAIELLESGTVDRVLGWEAGEFSYDITPHCFSSVEEVENSFIFNLFAAANLSKYLIAETKKEGRVAAFIKPCDSYSLVQLIKEHRINRDRVHIVGIQCDGKCDIRKLRAACGEGILSITEEKDSLVVDTLYGKKEINKQDVLLERCMVCKSHKIVLFDEILGEQGTECETARFAEVERLEQMSPEARFAYWQGELSRCIRCNACRNVCPACSCEKCVFDNANSGVKNYAIADSFEEKLFHVIRAFHVASRCTDCGECSRVCPQNIPLHLLNRKFISDINDLYGEYQAGADLETRPPLMNFDKNDPEPSVINERGEKKV